MIDGVPVPITVPIKTVTECFKHRNKFGHDVAVEALRDVMKFRPRPDLNSIDSYAHPDRVSRVIRPQPEVMT